MDEASRRSAIALPIVLLIAAGIAWSGSQGGATFAGVPIFAISVGLAFLVNWIAFIPAFRNQTEKYYDLTGTITFLTVTIVALLLSPNITGRGILLAGLIGVWTIRLGAYLFNRIQDTGKDSRFDEIKPSFIRYLLTWTLQGMWVTFSLAAALVAITTSSQQPLGIFALVGFLVWLVGFGIEVVADAQKNRFRKNPDNQGQFIQGGLWAWSRHPNYFGEIMLWVGIAIIALPIFQGWQWVTLISPVFTYILLTRVSGVPMLEERADKKWGGQPDYEAYKTNTPVLMLRPPKK